MGRYGGTVTLAGRNLIASLVSGEVIEFTRVVIGSGVLPDDQNLAEVTQLVNPVVEGTSSEPIVSENAVNMTVEYRNDMHGGLQTGFWISEFGVYAKTKWSSEVLLYYATLGDNPQPVSAYSDNRVEVRRYPIVIAASLTNDVVLQYGADAFVTSKDVNVIVENRFSNFFNSFFCVGNIKPTGRPSFWFNTSIMEEDEDFLLILGQGSSAISAEIDDTSYSVDNANNSGCDDGVNVVEIE